MSEQTGLRLMAMDQDDLKIISAACQDSVCKPADIVYEKPQRRLRVALNRYRWEATGMAQKHGQRIRTVLSFEDVQSVKARGLPSANADLVLSLLSVEWEASSPDEPDGKARLIFAGDGELLVEAECLNVVLADTSKAWPTRNQPEHKDV